MAQIVSQEILLGESPDNSQRERDRKKVGMHLGRKGSQHKQRLPLGTSISTAVCYKKPGQKAGRMVGMPWKVVGQQTQAITQVSCIKH